MQKGNVCHMKEEIFKRKSIRKYSKEKVSQELMEEIKEKLSKVTPLYDNIKFQGHLIEDGERLLETFKGVIGNYGKVIAPHYIVVTSEEKEGYKENVGYTFEKIVLWLTGRGIGTCWIGSKIKRELLEKVIIMDEGQVPIILIAFGYPQDINYFNLEMDPAHKRKDLEEIVDGRLDDTWEKIFQGVRRAPSGVNLQPWRFVFKNNKIHCYLKESFIIDKLANYGRVDGGIALSHLEIMCKLNNTPITFVSEPEESKSNHEYLVTAVF